MGNTRNGREALQNRRIVAIAGAKDWEALTSAQKLQKLVDNGHGHTKLAKKLRRAIVDARLKKGDV